MLILKISAVLCYCLGTVFLMNVTMMQYHFWFKDKIHENWIIDSIDKSHMITCVKMCQQNNDCGGLALGPLDEEQEEHSRTCLLLANVDETDCDADDDCARDGFQIYLKEKRLTTTTEAATTVTSTSTTTESTTEMELETTSTTTKSPTTTTTTTTEMFIPDEETTTTTTAKTTTTTTTTPVPVTTTTTTTETPVTTEEDTTTTTTTTESLTTTTTEEPTTTTEAQTTTTEAPTTTTKSPTTTTTTEAPTTTTTKRPTTTTEKPTTTTKAPTTTTTTAAPTTTTTLPTTTTTEGTTTTTAVSTTTESAEPGECQSPEVPIACDEPKTQYLSYGLKSDAPLFTDANMKAQCEKLPTNVFKATSNKKKQKPFAGTFTCQDDETMTGLEVCFVVDVIYIAPYCTPLEPGYRLVREDIRTAKNSKEKPGEATCPDKMAQITLKLEKNDDTGEIAVTITCAKVENA